MKSTVALVITALVAITVQAIPMEKSEKFEAIVDECKEKHSITQEELDGLKKVMVPESDDGKCFVGCVLEGMEVIKDGKFSKEMAEEHARKKMHESPEELEKHLQLINKCSEEVADHSDKCETGPKLMACIKTHAPGLGIILPGSEE